MKKALKRGLSVLLAITIIFGSVYVGLSEVDFNGLFVVKTSAVNESDIVEFDGHAYQIFDTAMTWTEAQIKCEKMGGYLVTITSQEEQNFVTNLLSNREQNCYWLGATDKNNEGVWEWVTEEPFEYTNWKSGEPNNETETEHYLEIFAKTYYEVEVGQWNDIEIDGRDGSKSRPFYSSSSIGYICEWDGISKIKSDISVLSYEKLKVISSAEASYINSTLNVSAKNYYTVNIPDCTLEISAKMKVGVVPTSTESNITAVHCNGYDALVDADKVKFPITGLDDDSKTITINVYTDLTEYKEFQLLQQGNVIQKSTTGEFKIIAGTIPVGEALSVRVVGTDGTKHKKIKTNIKTYESPELVQMDGKKISLTIPKDIDVLSDVFGGAKIEFDLEEFPFFVYRTEDCLKIGIGASKESKFVNTDSNGVIVNDWQTEDSKSWGEWKNIVDNFKKDLSEEYRGYQVMKCLHQADCFHWFTESGFSPKGSISLCAYAEFKKVNGEWITVGSNGVFSAQLKISKEWQTFILSMPIVLKLSGSVGAEADFDIGFDFNNFSWYTDCDVTFDLPKVKGSAGVGIANIVDGSAFLEFENKVTLAFGKKYANCVLTGSFGTSGKFLGFSTEKKWWEFLNWQYYYSSWADSPITIAKLSDVQTPSFSRFLLNSDEYTLDSRGYLESQSEWYGSYAINMFSLGGPEKYTEKLLQESIYETANPIAVTTDSGITIMVWTADIPERTSGNHTAIVYSTYDNVSDTWSVPEILNDDGTADSYPDIATDGNDVYVAWVNTNKTFDETATMEDVAKSCEISVAKFNLESGKFNSAVTITDDEYFNGQPSVFVADGQVHIAYTELTGDDVLTQNGTNSVYYAIIDDTSICSSSIAYSATNALADVAVGLIGEEIKTAIIADTDGDINTVDDLELFISDSQAQTAQFTNNTSAEQNIQFARINAENVLAYYADNNVFYMSDLSEIKTASVAGDSRISHEYKIVNDITGTVLITKCTENEESSADIYAVPMVNGVWAEPVKVTDSDSDIKSFDVYETADGRIGVVYTKTTVAANDLTLNEDGYYTGTYTETVDMYSTSFERYDDIAIQDIYFDDTLVVSNGEIPVTINVLNNGLSDINAVTLNINRDESTVYTNTITDINIAPGETAEIEITVQLGEITSVTSYDFAVNCDEITDIDAENDVQTINLGYTDLTLSADRVVSGGSTSAIVLIKNNTGIETSATLNVRRDTYDGEIVKSMPIENIGAYEELTYQIEKDFIADNFDYGDVICFEVVSDKNEKAVDDNNQYTAVSTPEIDEFNYEILEDNCISITNYNWDETDIIIPETYDDYTVTQISGNAIPENVNSVSLPSTITSVTTTAFDSATELVAIYVAEGNTVYSSEDGILYNVDKTTVVRVPIAHDNPGVLGTTKTIGQYAFYKCKSENVVISDSVELIESNAFYSSDITEITIPEGVTEIKKQAFSNCVRLQKFNYNAVNCTVPSGVWVVFGSSSLFSNCTSLTEIVIGSSVEVIPSYIFYGRSTVTSVVFEEDSCLSSIKTCAFKNCSRLQSINIPESVTSISADAFRGCFRLEAFCVDEDNLVYSSQDGILFNKDKTKLIQCPEGSLLETYIIPDSVTELETYAFSYCDNLNSVTIPKTISYINGNAFRYCDNLKSVVIEDGVTQIGSYSFADCPSLTCIDVPRSVNNIDVSFLTTDTNCRIYCYYNSYAHTFAKENSLKYGFLDFNFLNNSAIDYDNRYMIVNTYLLNTLNNDIEIKVDSDIEFWVLPSHMKNGKQFFGTGSTVYIYADSAPQENYTLIVNGDINGDSVCDVLDASQVALVSNGHKTLDGAYAMAADSNSDDIVDVNDYQSIVNKIVA